jgi:hypothetical protein
LLKLLDGFSRRGHCLVPIAAGCMRLAAGSAFEYSAEMHALDIRLSVTKITFIGGEADVEYSSGKTGFERARAHASVFFLAISDYRTVPLTTRRFSLCAMGCNPLRNGFSLPQKLESRVPNLRS